jgi:hypothetical protein
MRKLRWTALKATALAFRKAAPDSETLIMSEGVFQTL